MKKRGQFYLMGAIVIVGILIALVSIQNTSVRSELLNVNDFSSELEIEGAKVLDYEQVSGNSEFENFARNYSDYVGSDIEIHYIVGDINNLEVYHFEEGVKTSTEHSQSGEDLNVTINGNFYEFDLTESINFNFVMIEKQDNERYIITK